MSEKNWCDAANNSACYELEQVRADLSRVTAEREKYKQELINAENAHNMAVEVLQKIQPNIETIQGYLLVQGFLATVRTFN